MKEIIIRKFDEKTLSHAKKRGEVKASVEDFIKFLELQLAVTSVFDDSVFIEGAMSIYSKMMAANSVQAQLDAYEGLVLYVD